MRHPPLRLLPLCPQPLRLPLRLPHPGGAAAARTWLAAALLGATLPASAQVALHGGANPPAKGGVPLEAPPLPRATEVAAAAPVAAPPVLPAAAQALLDEINRRRSEGATCGSERKDPAPPMRWSELLFRAADLHVRDMAPQRGGSIGHTGSNGSNVGQRAENAGYRWTSVGENVAAGRPSASATLAQWMASPGHCSNIMNPRFVDVAVAGLHLPGTTYNHYWVMVLARP
jgi:uncharacterized protein YkwD